MRSERQRFSPGAVRYDAGLSANYPEGRALSDEAAAVWRSAILPFIPRPATILDLGSGSGRFLPLLSGFQGARVIGVVEQQTCGSLKEFAKRSRRRADSSLVLLSDAEFEAGMEALDLAAAEELSPAPVIESLSFVVFRAPS